LPSQSLPTSRPTSRPPFLPPVESFQNPLPENDSSIGIAIGVSALVAIIFGLLVFLVSLLFIYCIIFNMKSIALKNNTV
jgi:hypothetical protein